MKRIVSILIITFAAINLVASNVITYNAPRKLPYRKNHGINEKAFNVAIKDHQFSKGKGTLVFEGELTSIGERAFTCSNITSIEIPNSVTSIGEYAFGSCEGLASIEIPNSVTSISTGAFRYSGLSSITIPNSVESIEHYVFYHCSNLTSVIIPNSVTTIGSSAFSNCENLRNVSIPNSVKTIGNSAFYACAKLESIEIPNSVISIQAAAFAWCTNLVYIEIPNSIKELDVRTFGCCRNLYTAIIPNSVTRIESDAFEGCNNLVIYVSPESERKFRSMAALAGKNIVVDSKLSDGSTAPLAIQPHGSQSSQSEPHSTPSHTIQPSPQKTSVVDINIPQGNMLNEKTFAVIIANEDYQEEANVPYAKHDGEMVRQYCQNTLGIPSENIHYRQDATLNNIRKEINWIKQVCEVYRGSASVIFYYAGHGIPDEQSRSSYLLPVDGSGNDVSTGYKLDDLYATLGKMPARHITIFMDACFSGTKREGDMLASARGVALKVKAGVPQGNMVVFSAAQGDETAYSVEAEGHGLFTYYMLRKLQESKGDVTLQELGDYIITNVSQKSIVVNGKSQTPTVIPATSVADEWGNWKLK